MQEFQLRPDSSALSHAAKPSKLFHRTETPLFPGTETFWKALFPEIKEKPRLTSQAVQRGRDKERRIALQTRDGKQDIGTYADVVADL